MSKPPPRSTLDAPPRYALGLMAGTSGDGVDAACARIEGLGSRMRVHFIAHFHRAFPGLLRRRVLAAMAPAKTTTQALARLHAELGETFAETAAAAIAALPPRHRPSVIGLAGQTLCHLPSVRRGHTVTLQLGDPARVARRTGRLTVGDFRQSDVAAGGQGAPLVPWTDWVLFRSKDVPRAVQNIGGIGNVTWLPPRAKARDVLAFDTGPGNMIIDALVAHCTQGRQHMDVHGRRAARGQVLHHVLKAWLNHPFFKQKPPKTTGRETFGRPFLAAEIKRLRQASRSPDDWIATATAFTARSIARACRLCLSWPNEACTPAPTRVPEIIVCGGGALNTTLMSMLSAQLPAAIVRPIDTWGIPAQAKEALCFAMLAVARLDGIPANLPQATGASRAAILGAVYLP